jgi:cystathionine beta-synthase
MKAKQIAHDTPGAILANQFYNQVNPEAHYATTGPEVWQQSGGRVTHFVAGAGTGGTISGVGKFLKEQNPAIKVICADPVGSLYAGYFRTRELGSDGAPYKVEGVGGDKVPTTVWWDVIDEFRNVTDKDAMAMSRRLAREEGILAGGSTGLSLCVALDVARAIDDPAACVVTVLADTGERYLSKIFNDAWLQENQLLDTPRSTVADLLKRRNDDAPPLVQVAPAAQVRQALNLMSTFGVSQLPVIEDGVCIGSLIEGTLMTSAIEQPTMLDRAVRDVMDPPFPVVEHTLTLDRLAPMLTRESPAALVTDRGKLVGIVSRYDVLSLMIGR